MVAVCATALAQPPNVVLFLVDDFGYGDISAEGNTQIQTPHIDRIAKEGMRFTRFYQSAAACAPTRAALLTGRHFFETGVWGVHQGRDYLRTDENTLGDLLQSAGYKTGVFGKWHSGKTHAFYGWNRGFDTAVHPRLYDYFDSMVLYNNKVVYVEGPMCDVVGNQAVRFIRENKDQPFFCYVPFASVHAPINSPEDLVQKYISQGYPEDLARLYGMIEVLDRNVGKVLDTLDELQLADNTLVMFMVDDGYMPHVFMESYSGHRMSGEAIRAREAGWAKKLRGTKATIHEGGQISPFYVRWPNKIKAGTESDVLSGVLDIYPTLADLSGAETLPDQLPLRGHSLLPVLEGRPEPEELKDRMYFDATNFYRVPRERIFVDEIPRINDISVHTKQFKYVRSDGHARRTPATFLRESLYDLSSEKGEEENLIDQHPELTAKLREAALNWRDEILSTGRAFQEVRFPVGDWQERGTPIGLDASFAETGSLLPSNAKEIKWSTTEDSLSFHLKVLEAGLYEVELIYELGEHPLGSLFQIGIEEQTAVEEIRHPERTRIGPFRLQVGPQDLTLRLKDLKGNQVAVEKMRLLVVHRLPEGHEGVGRDLGFNMRIPSIPDTFFFYSLRNETANFMLRAPVPTIQVKQHEPVLIRPTVANPEALAGIRVFLGFEQILSQPYPGDPIEIRAEKLGPQSLNVEFVNQNGTVNSSRVRLNVLP